MNAKKFLTILLTIAMLSSLIVISVSAAVGDINGDNKVNAKDYMMLKRYVLGKHKLSEDQLVSSDINGDGKINAKDYMMLKRHVLGTYVIGGGTTETAIDTIKATIKSKGELSTSFKTEFASMKGDAELSFEIINNVLTLCGHAVTETGAVVDIQMPFPAISETYAFSGTAVQNKLSAKVSGTVVAAEYSKTNRNFDVTIDSSGLPLPEIMLKTMCKEAMDQFLAEANNLLVSENVGVTIADLGFTTYYNEISK